MAQKFIGVTLPLRLGQTGFFEQSTTLIQQVRSNFTNLILTKKGERLGQPELGCDLWRILFEQINDETLENARLAVVSAVDRWIPFIELVNFEITPTTDENILNIKCLYRFRSNPNVTDTVTIEAQTETLRLQLRDTVPFQSEPTGSALDNFTTQLQAERIRRARLL